MRNVARRNQQNKKALEIRLRTDDGREKVLTPGESLRLGRGKSNDFVIADSKVSRFHAFLNVEEESVILSDLGSLNGTFINDSQISVPSPVHDGDVVRVGDCRISVCFLNASSGAVEQEDPRTVTDMERVVLTVLVVDVCGFSRISKVAPALEVTSALRAWLTMVEEVVTEHHGRVDKYLGDGVMAIWSGAERDAARFADNAFDAGNVILRRTMELPWSYAEQVPWRCRAVASSGLALIGGVGGDSRREVAVLGDAVNNAFWLEACASRIGATFILSEETARLLGPQTEIREYGTVTLEEPKGTPTVFTVDLSLQPEILTTARESVYAKLRQNPLVVEAFRSLARELRPELCFHDVFHSEDVFAEAVDFAFEEGCSERELELIGIAAAYHDLGYLTRREKHEQLSAARAEEAMRASSQYSEEEVQVVLKMILDTELYPTPEDEAQKVTTSLSKYLLDADLSNFGRADFFDRLECLRAEQNDELQPLLKRTLTVFGDHEWLCEAAKRRRQQGKLRNADRLRALIES